MSKLEETVFDREKKELFLETIEKDGTLSVYSNLLNKVSKIEEEENKAIYNMDMKELENLFRGLKIRGVHSMINALHICKRYIHWAKEHGYAEHEIDLLPAKFTIEYASTLIFSRANIRYTRTQVLEKIKLIDDLRYAAAILCLFEGIRGTGVEEIANLKISNLKTDENGGYYAWLTQDNGKARTVPISNELYNILVQVNKMTTVGKEELASRFVLGASPYIFKKVDRRNGNDDIKVDTPFLTRAILNAKTAFPNKRLTANDIVKSGIAHMANELMEKQGQRVLTNVMLKTIGEQFNLGIIETDDENKTYFSYSALKKMVDADYITNTYGEFKFEEKKRKNAQNIGNS